jgi:hypothetical protein
MQKTRATDVALVSVFRTAAIRPGDLGVRRTGYGLGTLIEVITLFAAL